MEKLRQKNLGNFSKSQIRKSNFFNHFSATQVTMFTELNVSQLGFF